MAPPGVLGVLKTDVCPACTKAATHVTLIRLELLCGQSLWPRQEVRGLR